MSLSTFGSVWVQARSNHNRYSHTGDDESDIRFLTLGVVGEAGELANFVKKRWRDHKDHHNDICMEIADIFAYTIMLADRMGMGPDSLIDLVAYKQKVFVEKMEAQIDLAERILNGD